MYRLAGVVIAAAAIYIGYVINSRINVNEISGPNEFITGMLRSEPFVLLFNKLKFSLGVGIGALGVILGWLSFGIGLILTRQRRWRH